MERAIPARSPSLPLRSARRSLAVLVLAAACGGPGPVSDDGEGSSTATPTTAATNDPTLGASSMPATGDGSSDTVDTAPTTGTGTSTDETATTDADTGLAPRCPDVRAFQCAEPIDCPPGSCGDPLSPFDADGCMRPPCTMHEQCEPGLACVRAEDYGGCASSGLYCSDDPRVGQCLCVSTPDCGGGHCLPEDEVPPLE
jgi:hypothetical protein